MTAADWRHWSRSGGEFAAALVCLGVWLGVGGAMTRVYAAISYALMADLATVGPLVLIAIFFRAKERARSLRLMLILAMAAMALWATWVLYTGMGRRSVDLLALAALISVGYRVAQLWPASNDAELLRFGFLFYGTIGLLALFGSIAVTESMTIPDFGVHWPPASELPFAPEKPEQWGSWPPRVLVTAIAYYTVVGLVKGLLTPARLRPVYEQRFGRLPA
jgi:hypothetical protein